MLLCLIHLFGGPIDTMNLIRLPGCAETMKWVDARISGYWILNLFAPSDINEIREENNASDVLIQRLLNRSEYLLAAILIGNNFVNVRFMLTFNGKIEIEFMARTVTVTLGPHYEEFIQANIAGGRYNNVSEVIRAGLRRLEEDETRLAAIRAALIEGEGSGVVEDFNPEMFLQKLNAEYDAEVRTL